VFCRPRKVRSGKNRSRSLSSGSGDHLLESIEEHHVVVWMLSELAGMDPADERFTAKVTVLIENVRYYGPGRFGTVMIAATAGAAQASSCRPPRRGDPGGGRAKRLPSSV
jgi:hypothetical protein